MSKNSQSDVDEQTVDFLRVSIPIGPKVIDVLRLVRKTGRPFMLEGHTGVGKSALMEQFAAAEGINSIVVDLSLMEATDLLGLPVTDGEVTRYKPPAFLPRDPASKGVILFEELNRAPAHVRAPCLQLLTARTLQSYQLPPGWIMGAAINGGDEYVDTHELDSALLARFCRIRVHADQHQWAEWAERHGLDAAVIAIVRKTPGIFNGKMSNPRSWHAVSDLLKARADLGAPTGAPPGTQDDNLMDDALAVGIAGWVGSDLADSFRKHREMGRGSHPAVEEMIASYTKAHRATIQAMTANGDTAGCQAVAADICMLLQDPDQEDRILQSVKKRGNLGKLLTDLPAEQRRAIVEDLPALADLAGNLA